MPLRLPGSVGLCILYGSALVACAPAPPQEQSAPAARLPAEDRAAIETEVRKHWAAINTTDTATVTSQHTSDLTIIMTEFPDRFAIPSPTADSLFPILLATRPRYQVEDLQLQLWGDVGVASFYLTGGTVLPGGKPDNRRRRVTEVWARQADGTWKEMHHHDSAFSGL